MIIPENDHTLHHSAVIQMPPTMFTLSATKNAPTGTEIARWMKWNDLLKWRGRGNLISAYNSILSNARYVLL